MMELPDELRGWSFDKACALLYFEMNEVDGEVNFTRDTLAAKLRLTAQQVRTLLVKLEEEGYVKIFTSKKGSKALLTNKQPTGNQQATNRVIDSQQVTIPINQQVTNKQPTSNQQKHSSPSSLSPTTSITSTTLRTSNPTKERLTNVSTKKGTLQERQQALYETLVPFVEEYGKEMVRAFYDYWSEPNQSGTKMRQEMEKTWDTTRRLRTWHQREARPVGRRQDTGVILTNTENNDYEPW